jgi:chemotaxis family two-component system sensor kinase Cph1
MLAKTFAAVRGRVRSEPLGGSGGQRSGTVRPTNDNDGRAPSADPPSQTRLQTANVGRVSRLFREVYETERLNAGVQPLARRPEPVRLLAEIALARMQEQAEARGVTLHSEVGGDLFAWCERDRILKVLLHLLSNGIAATPQGGKVVVTAQVRENRVVVSVTDEGAGLDPRTWPFLFREGWKDPHRKGEGLGLSISHAIVQAHGGKIWCKSVLGQGTTLSFTLPVAS